MTQYQALIIGFGKAGKNVGGNSGEDGMARGDYRTVRQYVRRNLHQHWLYSNENAGA